MIRGDRRNPEPSQITHNACIEERRNDNTTTIVKGVPTERNGAPCKKNDSDSLTIAIGGRSVRSPDKAISNHAECMIRGEKGLPGWPSRSMHNA